VGIEAAAGDRCPDCDMPLEDNGVNGHAVLESRPVKAERVLYRLPKRYYPRCRRTFQTRAPAVLPEGLYGHQPMATAATMHSLCRHLSLSMRDNLVQSWSQCLWPSKRRAGRESCIPGGVLTSRRS
jgi:hypothetical protein